MKKIMTRVSALILASAALVLPVLSVHASEPDTAAAPTQKLTFTEAENKYILSHKAVKIGYVTDRVPVSFKDKNGELGGISRHIFDHVSSLCGIKFEYVPLPDGEVTYDYLISEGLDLVSSVEYNSENQHARGILISDPYLSSKKVVVAREELEFSFSADLSIAISTGSQTIRKVLGASYPNFELVDYPSIRDCFDAVNTKKADLLMLNQYVAEYWIAKPIYEKLKVIPVLGLDDELCFSAVVAFNGQNAPSQEEGEILIGILNKAIAAISEDEIGSFTIQGITENRYAYSLSDFLYRYRVAVCIFIISAFLIITLTALLLRQRIKIAESRADSKVKGQFLSTMSHEIRTPLNGLIGLNYLMSQKLDDKERMNNYLRQSTVTANYLLSLVNDMLDMSGLQTQALTLYKAPLDLDLIVGTVNSITEKAMSDKGLAYTSDVRLGCPHIVGDAVRIQQVLLNLLDNARKFTPEGGSVTLTVRQNMTDDDRIKTVAVVTDNGRGMTEEFQKHIFDAFARELDTVSKGNQGTGLGLPISRRLANLMDGDITFESTKGKGSSFTFTFISEPATLPDKGESESAAEDVGSASVPKSRPRILIAEDNELNGEIITELLESEGFVTDLAENGKAALHIFSNSTPGTYGVVLMDLLMPEMDGFEAAKAIRALDRSDAKTVRIFACTANCSSEDRHKALDAGMDDFIPKPVDIDILLKKLNGR